MKLILFKAVTAATMCTLALAGCGLSNTNESTQIEEDTTSNLTVSTEVEQTEATEGTVVVKDARGQVEIPLNPQRIVDLSGNTDILSILGYSVVGTANSDAYDYTKYPSYLEDVLEDAEILGYSMQETMDVEAILGLNPDMIIISSVQEKMYEQLQEVAPTVMIELAQIDWTEDIMDVAAILDKTEEATQWIENYRVKANEIGTTIKETYGEDSTYLSFLASGGNIYIFDAAGIGDVIYSDLGLVRPEGMPEQTDISLPVVTYEGLAAIDADYIFAVGTEEDLAALYESSIWQNIRAVTENRVIELPSSPYFNIGYSSIGRSVFIEEITALLETVNEK